jgi:RimJ/RimL family protein N-acetyltransferase
VSQDLRTRRLWLVPCTDEHLDGLSAIDSDPEVMRYITGRPETREETRNVIERVKARWRKWGYSWWSFVELSTREVVGAGCIQNLRRSGADPDPDCPLEIGWRIRRDRWRQGLAIEAAIAMADFAFEALHAELLLAVCHAENTASRAVMVKLGMRYRGMEQWYAQSLATYEILSAAWRARPAVLP